MGTRFGLKPLEDRVAVLGLVTTKKPRLESDEELNVFSVDHPEQFPLATAAPYESASQLTVTGTVAPDITRSVPFISIATGRVVELHARLGDTVKKG